MPKRPRIGVIGSTNMDLTTTVERMPVWGETVLATHFETSFGGKGANQAVAAAKLGAEVVLVSNLGDDSLGDSALKEFRELRDQHAARPPHSEPVDRNGHDSGR
jgi:ribokinase